MLEKQNMSNAAYSEEYLRQRKEIEEFLFIQEKLDESSEQEEVTLSDSLVWVRKHYVNGNYCGSDNTILREGNRIYSFKNFEDQMEFCKFIHHANGNDYLLFRRDLYGYSVLNLNTLKDFHYYPRCSLGNSVDNKHFEETFIWTNMLYNPNNNLLVGYGCYWACPMELALVDFSNPFKPAENQVFIYSKKNTGDIKSYAWQKNTLVVQSEHERWMKGCKPKKGQSYNSIYIRENSIYTQKTHKLTEALCRKWLAEEELC